MPEHRKNHYSHGIENDPEANKWLLRFGYLSSVFCLFLLAVTKLT